MSYIISGSFQQDKACMYKLTRPSPIVCIGGLAHEILQDWYDCSD